MYSKFKKEDLELRDYLAIDRTILANESTFMSYIRTALTFLVVGISFIKFIELQIIEVLGWIFIPLGLYMFIIGLRRYMRIKNQISRITLDKEDAEII